MGQLRFAGLPASGESISASSRILVTGIPRPLVTLSRALVLTLGSVKMFATWSISAARRSGLAG